MQGGIMTTSKKSLAFLWKDILKAIRIKDPRYFIIYLHSKRRYSVQLSHKKIDLTPRELQTLRLLIHGKTVRQAANAMSLSHRTVEFYVKNVRKKFKCQNKHRLVKLIKEKNILDKVEES